jgi:hypothetical protein
MTAGVFTLFSKNKDRLSELDLTTTTLKLALVSSVWTPDATVTGNSLWADMSANEIANGQGYTTGGVTLSTVVATAISGGFKLSSAAGLWTASGTGIPAHRYYVMYALATLWGRVNPVVGYFLGDATPADVPLTTAGNTLTITPSASGWFDLT